MDKRNKRQNNTQTHTHTHTHTKQTHTHTKQNKNTHKTKIKGKRKKKNPLHFSELFFTCSLPVPLSKSLQHKPFMLDYLYCLKNLF